MKNYDETVNSVFEKIYEYNHKKMKRKNFVFKTVVPISSLCLVLALTVVILKNNGNPKAIIDSSTSSEKIYTGALVPNDMDGNEDGYGKGEILTGDPDGYVFPEGTSFPEGNIVSEASSEASTPSNEYIPNRFKMYLNQITQKTGAAKLNFSDDKYYSEEKSLEDLKEYYGKDFSKIDFIDDLLPNKFEYSGVTTRKFYYEKSGKIAYDTSVFSYTKDEQAIRIMVSKIGAPYDCVYKTEEDKTTKINDVDVLIGFEPSDDKKFAFVFAEFSHNSVNFRITMENIVPPMYFDNSDMMYKFVYNIIKRPLQ